MQKSRRHHIRKSYLCSVNKNIYLNRGDAITLQLVNNEGKFEAGDKIKFYVCANGDYTNILFEKEFTVEETSNFAEIKNYR